MGFGSAIGGAYTTSIVADMSGYKTDKGVAENNKLGQSNDQLAQSLANAAAMQELLAAKQLAAITKVNAMQRTHGGMTSMMSAAGSGRPLLVDRPDTASGGMASAWARTMAVEQAARQRADELSYQISIRLQQNLSSYVIAQIREQQAARERADSHTHQIALRLQQNQSSYVIAQIREQQAARQAAEQAATNFRLNQERNMTSQIIRMIREQQAARQAAEQAAHAEAVQRATRYNNLIVGYRTANARATIQEIRAQQAAAVGIRRAGARDTIEGIRNQQSARLTGIATGLGLQSPAALNDAQRAIARMRADLEPMVGFEMRLAEEAREFRNYVVQSVAAGRMQVTEAQQLTEEFQQQANLLRQRAAHEHQGFLGMRRMGFAAQQLGYAVEDAASQFGTMGLAGAFRAGANNLTAMAAVMSVNVGIAASLLAAALSLGIQWWENKKRLAENTEEAKKLKAVTDNISSSVEFQISLQRQLTNARKADHAELASMVVETQKQIEHEQDALAKRLKMESEALKVRKLEEALAKATDTVNRAGGARAGFAHMSPEMRARAEKDIAIALEEQTRLQNELTALKKQQANEAARAVSEEAKIADLMKQQEQLTAARDKRMREEAADKMIKGGIEADQSAVDSITQRFEALNPELRIQNEILDARIKLNEQINIGLRAGQIQVDQAERYREAFEEVVRLEAEKRAGEKNLDNLAKEQANLIELANRAGTPAGIAGAVKKGSDEAARIIESEKLRRMAAKDQEPVVNELRRVKAAIEAQKAALEAIAANIPQVATIP